MKKIFTLITIALIVASCGVSKKAQKNEFIIPLTHTMSTSSEYVVFAFGDNYNFNMAREIAMNECYGQLARNLESRVKSAVKTYSDNYYVSDVNGAHLDDSGVTERIITTITNTRIGNLDTIEQKYEKIIINGRDGYRCWLSMSMPKQKEKEIVNDVVESLVKSDIDPRLKAAIKNNRAEFEGLVLEDFASYENK